MKIEDLYLWKMNPKPVEGCEIKCRECKEWSKHTYWEESEVGCEDCGSHAAIMCPECYEKFDHIDYYEFETR